MFIEFFGEASLCGGPREVAGAGEDAERMNSGTAWDASSLGPSGRGHFRAVKTRRSVLAAGGTLHQFVLDASSEQHDVQRLSPCRVWQTVDHVDADGEA
jgi:hypothetical protein